MDNTKIYKSFKKRERTQKRTQKRILEQRIEKATKIGEERLPDSVVTGDILRAIEGK